MDFKYTISKSELHKCGVYVIKHNRSKKTYVGSSKKIYYRIARHKCDLVKNKHCNQHLQNAINKYGICNFEISILEECCESDLAKTESYWISKLKSIEFGYNKCDVTDLRKNLVSEETRSKISKTLMGGKHVVMRDTETMKILHKFNSLYDASEYILKNKLSNSKSPSNVRMKISESIRSKLVSSGNNRKANRRSAYGYKWEVQ